MLVTQLALHTLKHLSIQTILSEILCKINFDLKVEQENKVNLDYAEC